MYRSLPARLAVRMTDELTLRRDLDRAVRAEALLADDIFREAFDKLRADYLSVWEATSVNDSMTREKTWLALRALSAMRGHIEAIVRDGAVSAKQLRNLEEASKVGRPRNAA